MQTLLLHSLVQLVQFTVDKYKKVFLNNKHLQLHMEQCKKKKLTS